MPINPFSPLENTSPNSAVTVWTVPSVSRLLSTPDRSVNSIVPSGVKARSQGMVRPETRVETRSLGGVIS